MEGKMIPTSRFRLISESTRQFFQEASRLPGYSLLEALHGYLYARWPYLYISIGTGEHPLARRYGSQLGHLVGWLFHISTQPDPPGAGQERSRAPGMADTYHGKVVPLAAARQLVSVKQAVTLPNLEPIIPFDRARDLIMRNPEFIVALDCPCRMARENPCLPLDVCLIIGDPFASFILEHHPQHTRRITPEEAVEILQAEDDRGHVHHAFFKDAMLNRFYAICNCCSCCCGAMQAQRSGTPMLISSGFVSQVDQTRCVGCGNCEQICPFDAIHVPDGFAIVDEAACMGCGVCVNQCTQEALSLRRDPTRSEPLEIERLLADVPDSMAQAH
jgi:ferredoxin